MNLFFAITDCGITYIVPLFHSVVVIWLSLLFAFHYFRSIERKHWTKLFINRLMILRYISDSMYVKEE